MKHAGTEVTVRGVRQPDGSVAADEIEARPNSGGFFEEAVVSSTNETEAQWLKAGHIAGDSSSEDGGQVIRSGPSVDRIRRIVDRLAPPYRPALTFRSYVVENKDWNAMAMGNGAVWVFRGLLRDMDDDETALVVGHELAHVTHEHSRREFRKGMVIRLLALGVTSAAGTADEKTARQVVQLATLFTANVLKNGYSRELEDQADRVGLRYAYESGFDIRKAPRMWERFGAKYGAGNKAMNYLFGGHSTVQDRVRNLRCEIALNYPDRAGS